ncbi:MAG: GDP-mannose 4,6-dehydratase [Gemmataceae bacterium]
MAEAKSHRNLITGITGFVGGYLTQALLERGDTVVGMSLFKDWPPGWKQLSGRVDVRVMDVGDRSAVEKVLHEIQPTRIYHLAGFAQVGESFRDPDGAWAGNLTATRKLLEAIAAWGKQARILFVGSGLIYGPPLESGKPFDEDCLLRPDTPYSSSKSAADLTAYQFFCSSGLDIVRARPFNHTGPHQSPAFAIPNFARQLVAIERKLLPPVLETGNLSTQRDISDVRDVVLAYQLLMERGKAGEAYNIASGQTSSMQEILDLMLRLTGLKVELRQREDLLRPTEPHSIRVNIDKIIRDTGWRPRFSLEQTLRDCLQCWRDQS